MYSLSDESPANPLGPDWTLSPHWTNGNRFISYSIEPACLDQTLVPAAERATNRTYLFAKTRDYIESHHNDTAWTLDDLGGVIDRLGLDMIAGIRDEDDETSRDHLKSLGIDNKGRLDAHSFRGYVSSSRLFVGVGRPRISPSPLEALCLGVPFINPIGIYDHEDVWNVSAWNSQHWAFQHMEPPYVYNVFARDIAGLESAIVAALAHPIDS
ncbi:hypothetical protein FFLO_04762 [Filobasidium floriforme]|uniref:Glycosyltransferase family 18 catalytic domain-containing protein n=1 Tax=Filobasidium floriforme TaxID=5210 RepID=A0A8K0JIA6_9TREE|nr:uncharacterized protein HD553DRAFT_274001 [Filobasidium floriforme]KAG7530855.1 hypothetical protein FFLO_04762 [Filobasidium floriforme]KAH8082532.1 hypothetical protein HD553DRAFT_274001 [Filobasidium floriforme]